MTRKLSNKKRKAIEAMLPKDPLIEPINVEAISRKVGVSKETLLHYLTEVRG